MKGLCPVCMEERSLRSVETPEDMKIREERIVVPVRYLECETCGESFDDPDSTYDPHVEAYREYRRRKGMVQPEEIRAFRAKYGLTQSELRQILGWGGATLSRYENGALQDEAHDKALRLAMEPRNLLKLIEDHRTAISPSKREAIMVKISGGVETGPSSLDACIEDLATYSADHLSGYKRLDAEKLENAVLYFCRGQGVPKTKLNKLLFYADFLHYRDYGVSITGSRYAHLPYGPVPDGYEYMYAMLLHGRGSLKIEERWYDDFACEELVAEKDPDLNVFSTSELRVLSAIKEQFESYSARRISDQAHGEKAYAETETGTLISYEYADGIELTGGPHAAAKE